MRRGILMVVSGPAGSGKGTVCRILRESGEFSVSVSRTTRNPRPGELDGKDYLFVSKDEFRRLLDEGDFIEHNEYCNEYYGTPKKATEAIIAEGKNVILEIDVNGGAQVKRQCPDAVLVMLMPPTFAEQESRLRGRGTETEEKIQSRLAQTKIELDQLCHYDYIVYNYDGETQRAADEIVSIAKAEKCATYRNPDAKKKYFAN